MTDSDALYKQDHPDIAWRRSLERKTFTWQATSIYSLTVVGSIFIYAWFAEYLSIHAKDVCKVYVYDNYLPDPVAQCLAQESSRVPQHRLLIAGALIPAAAFLILFLVFYAYRRKRQQFEERAKREEAERKLANAQARIATDEQLHLAALWAETNERLSVYHTIATQQANASFRRAQAAMIWGFLLIAVSLIISVRASSEHTAVTSAILGGVAAALSGYIGNTFLRSQENSSGKLRSYFSQPLELFRYLVAERLIEKLPNEDNRAQGVLKLVEEIGRHRPESETTADQSNSRSS